MAEHGEAHSERVCVLMQPPYYPLPGLMQQLEERYNVLHLQESELDPKAASTVSGLIVSTGVDRRLLDSLPNLRIISSSGIGVDNIDVELCRQRGICVTNAAHGSVVADTADLAILLMLACLRRLPSAHSMVQRGLWSEGSSSLTRKASGLRVGIVGLGRIGTAIARRAVGLNSIVSYCGTRKKQDVPYAYYSDPINLAVKSDVLIVACHLSKETKHLIGKDVLDALGPKGTLINIARGPIVDELELCKALVEGRLGGAGLDVFEGEPFVSATLMSMDNVVLSPHIGSATWDTRCDVAQLIVDNLNAFFSGKPVLTAVL